MSMTKNQLEDRIKELETRNSVLQKELSEARSDTNSDTLFNYRNIFEKSIDGIGFVDMDGFVTDANESLCKMLGYSIDELKNMKFSEFTAKEYNHLEADIIEKQVMSRGYSDVFEKEYIHRDGTQFPVSLFIILERDRDGNPKTLWAIVRNISEQKKKDRLLREQGLFLENVFEAIPYPLYVLDASTTKIVMKNSAAESSIFIENDICNCLAPNSQKECTRDIKTCPVEKVVQAKKHLIENRRKVVCNGKEASYEIHSYPLIQNDQVTHIIVYAFDVTQRDEVNRKLEMLSTAVEQVYDAVVITDVDGHIKYVNPAFERITGYELNEVLDQKPSVLKSDEHSNEFYAEMWNTITDGRIWHNEVHNRKKNGDIYTEEMTITPVMDEEHIHQFVAIKRDISQRKELEESLIKMRNEHESFLRHELFNFLTPIKAYSELLLSHFSAGLNEKQTEYLSKIKQSTNIIISLINNLKTLQDLEFGGEIRDKIHYEIEYLVQKSVSDLSILAGDSGVKLNVADRADNTQVNINPDLFQGVIHNLLKNAIEHVENCEDADQKTVKVTLTSNEESAILKINNKGIPIPKEKVSVFFEKFNTDRMTKKGGTGLGTTYAHLVTKAHHGNIHVTSNESEGTTVTVEVPLVK